MKKLLVVIFAMIFCISSLTNCQTSTGTPEPPTDDQEHEHIWSGNTSPSTRYYFTQNCSICGAQERVIVKANAYWDADYTNGKITLGEPTIGDTAIELVAIDKITIQNEGYHDSFADITLRIRTNESKTYRAYILSYRSPDDEGGYLYESLDLVQGKETTWNFKIYGFYNSPYDVAVEIDNTAIVLRIHP